MARPPAIARDGGPSFGPLRGGHDFHRPGAVGIDGEVVSSRVPVDVGLAVPARAKLVDVGPVQVVATILADDEVAAAASA